MQDGKNYFERLTAVDVGEHIETKNGLSYLPWAWAWSELKKRYPQSYYTIYENAQGWNYHTDGHTCWVKTGVTVVSDEEKIEHIEYLPVMDYRNRSIPLDSVTSFDVNRTIQRSLTKAVARHGLGLYVYAGEDLPEDLGEAKRKEPANNAKRKTARDALISYINSHDMTMGDVARDYKLNKDSTNADFKRVLKDLEGGDAVDAENSKD